MIQVKNYDGVGFVTCSRCGGVVWTKMFDNVIDDHITHRRVFECACTAGFVRDHNIRECSTLDDDEKNE